jgi:hypothetical protein
MPYSMPHSQANSADDWEQQRPLLPYTPAADGREPRTGGEAAELEPGWSATRSLMQFESDELQAIMLRPSFRPVREMDLVPVSRCPYCLDGGLRMAGTVRVRAGRATVRACDTCATVDIDGQVRAHRRPRG